MKDKRAFAVFDVGYLDNPKIAPLLDEGLSNAILMHAASVMYCAQHLTDGFITERAMQRKIGATQEDADRLVIEQLWHRAGHTCSSCPAVPKGKAFVHDYLEHNRSSEGVKRASQKGREAAVARWNAGNNTESNAPSMPAAVVVDASSNAESNAKPMPRQTDRQTEENSSSEVAHAAPRPEVEELLDLLDERIEANGTKKPSRTKRNMDAARLLLDKDGYTTEQVAWMIKWATNDEFWRGNILSMSKLREKFDQLRIKSGVGRNQVSGSPDGIVDVDAVLGADYWVPGPPPEGLSLEGEIEWKKEQRERHHQERLATARERISGRAA